MRWSRWKDPVAQTDSYRFRLIADSAIIKSQNTFRPSASLDATASFAKNSRYRCSASCTKSSSIGPDRCLRIDGFLGTSGACVGDSSTGRCNKCEIGLSCPGEATREAELSGGTLSGGVGRVLGSTLLENPPLVPVTSARGDLRPSKPAENGGVCTVVEGSDSRLGMGSPRGVGNSSVPAVRCANGDFADVALPLGFSGLLLALRGVDLVTASRRESPGPSGLTRMRSAGHADVLGF